MAVTMLVKRYVNVIVERTGKTKSEAIREAIRSLADEVKGTEVVKIREISRKQARREILEYLDKKERAWSSEIADTLRLDLTEVNRILEQLWGDGRVEPTT